MVLLAIHLGEARSLLFEDAMDVQSIFAAYNLIVVLILLHDDYDVVVHGKTRRPGKSSRIDCLEGKG